MGGTVGHQLQFSTVMDLWHGNITIIPQLRPGMLIGPHKGFLRASLNVTMAAPSGEVITNVINIKEIGTTT